MSSAVYDVFVSTPQLFKGVPTDPECDSGGNFGGEISDALHQIV